MEPSEQLKKITMAIQELPTLNVVALKVNRLLRSSTAGSGDLAKVIQLDQSITARLLSLVNSAAYGLRRKVSNVQEAVSFLGTNTVSQIVLGLGVLSTFSGKDNPRFSREKLWFHSLAVAVLARKIARVKKCHKQPEDVFTAGLLHDLGKVAIDHFCNESFELVLDELEQNPNQPFHEAEKKVYGLTHNTIGEWVARNWELPRRTIVAIKHHHQPPGSREGFHMSDDTVADLVMLADWIAVTKGLGYSGTKSIEPPTKESLSRLSITLEEAMVIADEAMKEIKEAALVLGIKAD
jgi:putative nucleotidyltransferase with HDIG domain